MSQHEVHVFMLWQLKQSPEAGSRTHEVDMPTCVERHGGLSCWLLLSRPGRRDGKMQGAVVCDLKDCHTFPVAL